MLKPFGGISAPNGGSNIAGYRAMIAAAPPPPAAVQESVAVKAEAAVNLADAIIKKVRHCIVEEFKHRAGFDEGGTRDAVDWAYSELTKFTTSECDQALAIVRSALSTSQSDPAPEIAAIRAENEILGYANVYRIKGALELGSADIDNLEDVEPWAKDFEEHVGIAEIRLLPDTAGKSGSEVRAALTPEQGEAK
jgi:hypothetical protein